MFVSQYRVVILTLLMAGCFALANGPDPHKVAPDQSKKPDAAVSAANIKYDPLKKARQTRAIKNYEATVPPQCYTKTEGVSNPCWTCHSASVYPNQLHDWELQEEYAFSDQALKNYWSNLFVDRTDKIAGISNEEILAYIRRDNYKPLRDNLEKRSDYRGYVPDLDLDRGFDSEGFAVDGSDWRALRYKPFPGAFWPTNGATDDVFIRLPSKYRTLDGKPNREIYKANLAILEAVIAAGPIAGEGEDFVFGVEPISEDTAGVDLNADGRIHGAVNQIKGFPKNYLGDAADEETKRYIHPKHTEYLHSVRYVDPDQPGMMAKRMKELRYSRKEKYLDTWAITRTYEAEYNEKENGDVPIFGGSGTMGLLGDFGWRLQGFIEDEHGRLRAQTAEETQFCMGCHNALGVTVDQTFTLARKVPGADGWRYQDIRGIQDAPQQGQGTPEILTYFQRVQGGDEFRANKEIIQRFWPNGKLDEETVLRASVGGDKDITFLITPTRQRALTLNKAYLSLVREQRFEFGREVVIGGVENIHTDIVNGDTELGQTGMVHPDGRLWLDWLRKARKDGE